MSFWDFADHHPDLIGVLGFIFLVSFLALLAMVSFHLNEWMNREKE